MIKRAELRTGNLFHNNLGAISILFVREIREDAIIGKELDGVFNGSFDEENISGVPLTKEWLLKFGFKKTGFSRWTNYNLITYGYEFIFGQWDKVILNLSGQQGTNEIFITTKYVHQLQNLYFALTGNELTLTSAKEETP